MVRFKECDELLCDSDASNESGAMPMNGRQLLGLGLLWVALVMLIAWQAGKQARDWQLASLHQQGAEQLLSTVGRLRSALAEYRYLPFLLTQSDDIRHLLSRNMEHSERVSRYLEQMNLVAGVSGLFVLDRDGHAVAFSHWREGAQPFAGSHAEQPYFTRAWSGEQGVSFRLQHGIAPAVFMSAPVYANSEAVGVAVTRINLSDLFKDDGDDGIFTVADTDQRIILSQPTGWQLSIFSDTWQPLPVIQVAESLAIQRFRRPGLAEVMMGQRVLLDDLGWTVTVFQSTASAQQHQRLMILAVLVVGGLLGLLGLLLRERRLKHHSLAREKAAEARHIEQQRTIISRSEVGLLTLNSKGQITFINPMAQRQFGVSMPLIKGLSIRSLLSELDRFVPLRRALENLDRESFSPLTGYEAIGHRGDDSEFPMLFSIRRMQAHSGADFLVTVIDISRRKRLEQALVDANESLEHKVTLRTRALEEAQQALVHAEKLAALGRMSSAMVHELNQPLTAMRTYIAICRQLGGEPEMLQQNLQLLDELAQRMASLTRQLKSFAARKPDRLSAVSLAAVLAQLDTLFRPRFEARGLSLSIMPLDTQLDVMADNARLEQVFSNLLQNSLDAIPSHAGEGGVTIRHQRAGTRLVIEVLDTGPGLAPEVSSQLFEPFVTSKPLGSGLGLGLAIVASIVGDLGGHIEAENSPTGGACFTLTLNLADGRSLLEE